MSDKATTISIVRRCAAVVEGPAAVLAKAIPSTPVDTQGAPCPGAYYCIAPGPDLRSRTEQIPTSRTDRTR